MMNYMASLNYSKKVRDVIDAKIAIPKYFRNLQMEKVKLRGQR